jgi:hypothetical protein
MTKQEIAHVNTSTRLRRIANVWLVALAAAVLAGCGGGAETVQTPVSSSPPINNYNGPPPQTADIQSFKLNVWDNVSPNNRCGNCHTTAGQVPTFARNDDINMAYQDANPLVDLTSPVDSRLVTKVGSGHNCWLSSDAACADIMTTWVSNWAGAQAGGGGRAIDLKPPVLRDPGDSRTFPASSALFASTVHPLLTLYCAGCHTSASATAQAPFFASADPDEAYDAAKAKINLDDPAISRFVLRLRDEFHNCWDDCAANGTAMETAITNFSSGITPTQIDPNFVLSKALTLFDGTIASGGNRFENNLIAMYEFKTGNGLTAFDTSGVQPQLDLSLSGDVQWVGGWGINIRSGKAQGSTASSKKIHDLLKGTGEYSIEAWVAPSNVTQEDSRIVSYSAGINSRNFNLGQTLYNYDFFNRATNLTDENGSPGLSTPDADEVLQATTQHVVANYDPVNGRSIFVNGVLASAPDGLGGGTLADWDDTFAFVLGNEVSGDRQWSGVVRMVAIHNRTLTEAQIVQNFDVGVGEKFFLLFSVEHLINVPESYILFEVAQFDSYSYLFSTPTFISLDSAATPDGIPLTGMRIGLNGAEADVGQAYAPLDTMITAAQYDPAVGQSLATIGTVVPLEKGPLSDEFFLTFEVLGSNTNVRTPATPLQPPPPPNGAPVSEIGVRTFDEINQTMANITGVSPQSANVSATYDLVKQSLPAIEAIDAVGSSHQIAVTQLAIEYCNSLVEDTALRTAMFPGFDFTSAPNVAFAGANRDLFLDPLINAAVGTVGSQPTLAEVRNELGYSVAAGSYPGNLIDRLAATGGSSPARTLDISKASCAAVVGSAATLVQ